MVVNYAEYSCGIPELYELETRTTIVKRHIVCYIKKNSYQEFAFSPQNFFRSVNKHTFWFCHFV